jgi:hypothetical protein
VSPWPFVLVYLLNALDGVATYVMHGMGVVDEANPLMAWMLGRPALFFLAKFGYVAAALLFMWRMREIGIVRWGVYLLLAAYSGVFLIHARIVWLEMLRPLS